jgi:hypothetical protein
MEKQLWRARVRITADIEFLFLATHEANARTVAGEVYKCHLGDREKVELRTAKVIELTPEKNETGSVGLTGRGCVGD